MRGGKLDGSSGVPTPRSARCECLRDARWRSEASERRRVNRVAAASLVGAHAGSASISATSTCTSSIGVAILTGTVDSAFERSAVEHNAFQGGAIAVDNELEIERP